MEKNVGVRQMLAASRPASRPTRQSRKGIDIEIDMYPLMSSQMPAPKLRSDRRTPEFSSFHCEARM
jgi:hypothetical protein